MFGHRITIFKLFGFEVRVDASWLFIALLITWTLAVGYFPFKYRGLPAGDYWWMGVVSALGLFGSIVVHEFSHSLVAQRYGLPMKGITLFIFGGVAEMGEEPRNAKTEFLMAIAGPITSIVIGAIFYAIYQAGEPVWPAPVAGVIGYLAWINWLLAAFNLIPAFPLDGGRVLRSALWHWNGNLTRATRVASSIGSGFGVVLILLGVWQLWEANFIAAIWWVMLGLFLRSAAQSSYRQLVIRQALEGEPVSHLMKTNPVTVSPDLSIEDLVEGYIYTKHFKMFPVVPAGSEKLAGCVTTSGVKRVPREEWTQHTVREVLQPCTPDNTISPDTDAVDALAQISKSGQSRLMVVDRDRLVGVIALKDLTGYLASKLELEEDSSPHTPHTVSH
ncbi:MAG TPA: site-2 protease family protein [Bryobacteraceae bacterium]|nr:site-2 protease family protein [Bryobacteraceae bacterium]